MKIRKMLRGIPLLFLMVSGLSVFLSCKGPSSAPTLYTVTFDAQGGSTVTSLKVEHGKTIAKPADPVKASFTFGGWYKESACTTPWNFATDTVTADITLFAKWIPVAPATVTVTFEAKAEHGTLKAKAGDTELKSGSSVKKGTEITFTADPKAGYEVDYWKINNEEKSGTHKTEKVKADKDLTVTVIFKTIGSPSTKIFTIQFKSSKMKCRKNGGGDINPGDTVHENDKLNFEAKLTEGKIVDKWTINGSPKDGATEKSFFYTVTASDVKDGSITIDYEDKKATSATIQFDSRKTACMKKDGTPVDTGSTVYEDTWLTFSAKLPEGKIVTKWLVNSSEKKKNSPSFQYTVRIADAQSGSIRVDYEEKEAAKATIQFDSNKMTCTKNLGKTTVTTGNTVYEHDRLNFAATPATGKDVQWTAKVNGVEKKKEIRQYFSYTIKADDDGKTLTVDYTEK
jgi:hypothetical protein